MFTTYRDSEYDTVKVGNNTKYKIVAIGDVYMNMTIECKLRLRDVRHIPQIRLNVISIDTLDDMGYHNFFGEDK